MRNKRGYTDIKGLPWYEINKYGIIRNKKTLKTRKPHLGIRGYNTVGIRVNGKMRTLYVHRLVAETFIPNPLNLPEVNHIDGDKTNNRVSNLERVTSSQNALHGRRTGLRTYDNKDKRKAVIGYNKDGTIAYEFESQAEAGRVLGLSRGSIGNVCRGIGKTYGGYIRKFKS